MTSPHPSQAAAVAHTDRITCDAALANLPALLALVAALCQREQIVAPTCHELQLIAEEACVNVMHHAYPTGQSGPLTLAVQLLRQGNPPRVVLTLEDQGRPFNPFNPLLAPAVDTTAAFEARALGGLGVHLIRQLSSRQHYQRHPRRGNVLVIEKDLAANPSTTPNTPTSYIAPA